MQRWLSVIVGFVLLVSGAVTLQSRVLDVFSLNRNLSLNVYFPSDACVNALDYVDKLNTDAYHFLLVSNCFHSKSFDQAKIMWRFDHILPSLIYDGTSGDQGYFFQTWLQKPTGRVENIPDRQFDALRLFQQPTDRKQIEALHFLCAHTELLAQHPKYAPTSANMSNYYALAKFCLSGTSHPHEQIVPTDFTNESVGRRLFDLFATDSMEQTDFKTIVQ